MPGPWGEPVVSSVVIRVARAKKCSSRRSFWRRKCGVSRGWVERCGVHVCAWWRLRGQRVGAGGCEEPLGPGWALAFSWHVGTQRLAVGGREQRLGDPRGHWGQAGSRGRRAGLLGSPRPSSKERQEAAPGEIKRKCLEWWVGRWRRRRKAGWGCRLALRALCPPAPQQQHFCADHARRLRQAGAVPGVQSGGPARPEPCLSPAALGLRLSPHGFRLWLIRGRSCARHPGGRAGGWRHREEGPSRGPLV